MTHDTSLNLKSNILMSNDKFQMSNEIQMTNVQCDISLAHLTLGIGHSFDICHFSFVINSLPVSRVSAKQPPEGVCLVSCVLVTASPLRSP